MPIRKKWAERYGHMARRIHRMKLLVCAVMKRQAYAVEKLVYAAMKLVCAVMKRQAYAAKIHRMNSRDFFVS